jgi:hypothetical protein
VPGTANADACRRILRNRPDSSVQLFPEHNHLFQRATSGWISEYAALPPGPDERVLAAVASWLEEVNG